MNKLQDYAHLYIGCEVIAYNSENEVQSGYLTGIHGEYGPEVQFITDHHAEEHPEYPGWNKVQLSLRQLSDITIEEATKLRFEVTGKEYTKGKSNIEWVLYTTLTPLNCADIIRLLCKMGFDVFSLIYSGLAVVKKIS